MPSVDGCSLSVLLPGAVEVVLDAVEFAGFCVRMVP